MKRKVLSTILALALCFGLAVPAFAAEMVTIKIPNSDATEALLFSFPEDSMPDAGTTAVSEITFTLENAPDSYYYKDGDYVFAVPEGCIITPSAEIGFIRFPYREENYSPENALSFVDAETEFAGWSEYGEGAFVRYASSFHKGDDTIRLNFFYLSPGAGIDLDDPENEQFKLDYEYDGIIDGNLPRGGHNSSMPVYASDTHFYALEEFGYERRPLSELIVSSIPTDPITPSPDAALTAIPTASTVLVNGENIGFDAYNIGGNNYFKLRDLAYTLSGTEKQFEVGWDGANNAIALTSGEAYTEVGGEMTGKGAGNKTPTATTSKIFLDGAEVSFTAYNIDGNNYFKLRDIGIAFDFEVDWDGARNTIVIDTSKGYTPD